MVPEVIIVVKSAVSSDSLYANIVQICSHWDVTPAVVTQCGTLDTAMWHLPHVVGGGIANSVDLTPVDWPINQHNQPRFTRGRGSGHFLALNAAASAI